MQTQKEKKFSAKKLLAWSKKINIWAFRTAGAGRISVGSDAGGSCSTPARRIAVSPQPLFPPWTGGIAQDNGRPQIEGQPTETKTKRKNENCDFQNFKP